MVREQRRVFPWPDRCGDLRSRRHRLPGGGDHARPKPRDLDRQRGGGLGYRLDRPAQDDGGGMRLLGRHEPLDRLGAHHRGVSHNRRRRAWRVGRLHQHLHPCVPGLSHRDAHGAPAPERPDGVLQQYRVHARSHLRRRVGVDVLRAVGVSVHGGDDGGGGRLGPRLPRGTAA